MAKGAVLQLFFPFLPRCFSRPTRLMYLLSKPLTNFAERQAPLLPSRFDES